ncbi:serine--pyruvate aminotransferase [Elysia marginata]|uniref:alanine--glyoxylate transaminase n=1 Tax=Elysia marginata TaxID=1093978 RepID=A0AAV4H6H9_9GAST|nr:serine--pyruvate aminotransferase [Elysia marginata]
MTRPMCAKLGRRLLNHFRAISTGQATNSCSRSTALPTTHHRQHVNCLTTSGSNNGICRISFCSRSRSSIRQVQVASFSSSASMSASVSEPPACLSEPINVPSKLLMGPGPSNAHPRVLAAGALPLLGHLHTEFTKIMDDTKAGIQYVFQTQNEWTFAVSGTGHAAMEAAVVNLLEADDVALVCQNGVWGVRLADMVERNGSIAKKITKPWGEVFSLEEIEEGLKEHKPKIVFVTYGESSGGTAQPLEGLGDLCHKYDALLLVDSVAIVGGAPMFMDAWNIDVLYAGAQKVLSAPPAASPISFNQRARDAIASRKTRVRSFYFDAAELANYWGCDEGPRRYHHTGMISSVYALREGLAHFAETSVRNPCVTTIKVPEGVDWKKVIEYAMKNHKLEIAGGLGELAGKVWRIGIMGYNCTPENVNRTLAVLQEALKEHWKKN